MQQYHEIWLVDFEFGAGSGERPAPRCLVARELRSRRTLRVWEDELLSMRCPPYAIGDDALFVAYYASAELGCHLALGWPLPENVLDLYVEFRNLTNGLELPSGNGLLAALSYFGLDAIDVAEKTTMRELALRGGPWTSEEQVALLDYCESDVDALERLLPKMEAAIDLPRALLRGRYMGAVAGIERAGVPVDVKALTEVRSAWGGMRTTLITEVDSTFGFYDGTTFKQDRFARWLTDRGIAWPQLPTGQLAFDDDTFRMMVRVHPELAPVHELRTSLSQLRLERLSIGADGRNRTLLSPFRSKTGRNQPSNSEFIFGPATWIRGFIRPDPGYGLAYIDYSQQEWGVAGALSGDLAMLAAYESGDAYLEFAKQAGAAPPNATKVSHEGVRERYKSCGLGVLFGMEDVTLAARTGQTRIHAAELLRAHRRLYRRYWAWSDAALDYAMLRGELRTVFGWTVRPGPRPNPRSLRNFVVQANAAEMLRIAAIDTTEAGVPVGAPVHDAFLLHAPLSELDAQIARTQQSMSDASAIVLGGFRLRTDVKIVRHPDRYMDKRGAVMWQRISRLMGWKPGR